MDIFSGNVFTLSYTTDLENVFPQSTFSTKINELAALPTLEVSSKVNEYEVYNNDHSTKLLAEQQIAPLAIVVNYIPTDSTHQFLDSAADTGQEFQIVLKYSETSEATTYAIVNGQISGASVSGGKDSAVQKTYTFQTTDLVARAGIIDALAPLYEGDYGVGSNGQFVPQYEPDEPTGNSFIKIPASQQSNPTGTDMMGVALVDEGTFSSIALTKSGSLSIFAKNQNTAWTRILTATQIANQYVPLTRTVNGKALSDNITLNSTDTGSLAISNNLSDLPNKATARNNLGVYSSGEVDQLNNQIQSDINDQSTEIDSIKTNLDEFQTSTNDSLSNVNSRLTTVESDYVPKTTTVNGQPLSGDVTITFDAYTKAESDSTFVKQTTTVNGQPLSGDVTIDTLTLTGDDLVLPGDITSPEFNGSLKDYIDNATPSIDAYTKAESDNKFVAQVTTINGHALSDNVTVTKGDVGLGNVTNDAQLKISSNLGDLESVSTAKSNLGIDRFTQSTTFVRLQSTTNTNGTQLVLADGGGFAIQTNAGVTVPISISSGGTGATTVSNAKVNLQVDNLEQTNGYTVVKGPGANASRIGFISDGQILFQNSLGNNIGLPITAGGTGAMSVADARANLGVTRFSSTAQTTTVTSPDGASILFVNNAGDWGCIVAPDGAAKPLRVDRGGTGSVTAAGARTNLSVYSKGEIDAVINHTVIPGTISPGQRVVLGNPYGASVPVIVEAEVYVYGMWFKTGWIYNSSSNQSFGVMASYIEGTGIVVQAGSFIGTSSGLTGDGSGQAGNISGLTQFRIQIWRVKQ
ncbi:hypothetical protein EDF81_0076 [Enterobacter sp. BIGb0383]|uniref:hypothetical protein n=1 Tax=unclassified Enterobacter TaxID=2608935 RepID=UPI000FA8F5F7|nr:MULTISPECIES: hypothetical protein [unclassified Enterobacter]ROP61605.1 hypothetical protein EDF81_0076 [Enterobacter sp. BIGb0383]ROS11766.1 hypothetical protein EC848_0076 [Enterobacter sp. BIGb0359]